MNRDRLHHEIIHPDLYTVADLRLMHPQCCNDNPGLTHLADKYERVSSKSSLASLFVGSPDHLWSFSHWTQTYVSALRAP